MMTKFCEWCGKQLEDGRTDCTKCGGPVTESHRDVLFEHAGGHQIYYGAPPINAVEVTSFGDTMRKFIPTIGQVWSRG